MKKKIPITKQNKIYAFTALDFTHNHSTVRLRSIMIDRNGESHTVTKINKDNLGRRQFWSKDILLTCQYTPPHNMLTKQPFFAHEFKINKQLP